MKAYSYARFSTPEQMNGDSLRRQQEMVDRWLAAHPDVELNPYLTYRDLGVSAHHGRNVREGALGQFLKAVDGGLVEPGSYLLVENLDRVSRAEPWDAFPVFQQIINAGITIVTLTDGKVWSREAIRANAFTIMESLIGMIRAHEESELKSKRVRAAWDSKRKKVADKPLTSRGPSWLKLVDGKWQVDEGKAMVVQRIFGWFAQGAGQHAIAVRLNELGVPVLSEGGQKGQRWHRSYIFKLLNSPNVVGTFVPHVIEWIGGRRTRVPQEPIEGYYPRIIDDELSDAVQRLLKSTAPLRGKHANAPVQNLLGGLAKCPRCGGAMTRIHKGVGRLFKMVCGNAREGGGCTYRSVDYLQVERAIVGHLGTGMIGDLSADAPALDKAVQEQIRELDGQIASLERKLNLWEAAIENDDGPPPAAALAKMRELEGELLELGVARKELEDQAASVIGPKNRLAALQACLATEPLNVTEANALLRQAVKAVVVDYERGDLVIQWAFGGESRISYVRFPAGRVRLTIK
jgi:DNA invertase Pin-like site-specific DNA recombinase